MTISLNTSSVATLNEIRGNQNKIRGLDLLEEDALLQHHTNMAAYNHQVLNNLNTNNLLNNSSIYKVTINFKMDKIKYVRRNSTCAFAIEI